MTPILETRQLEKRFGGVYAAKNVSVAFGAGEIVGVIGANGAGKTTFVNLVTGHLKPSAGAVLLEGADVSGRSPQDMTKLGVARSFQIPQLFRTLSVRENLVLAIGIWDGRHGGARQELRSLQRVARSEDMARLYGIEAYCDRVVASVPQGVRKLLDIAMAGVGEHKVLFLDEPTSGVSVEERDPLMRTVVANAGRSGTTLLIVEHDMDVIRRFVHRVIAFYQGEIICDAPTEQALKDEGVLKYILGRGPLEPARRQ